MFQFIRILFRCETVEKCNQIQTGSLIIRRLGKWSLLFSISFTLFIGDCIAAAVNQLISGVQKSEEFTNHFLYRWTVGWFYTPPKIDRSIFAVWKALELIQFVFFAGLIALAIRWTYADCCVRRNAWPSFKVIIISAAVTNTLIYYLLHAMLRWWWH